MNRNDLKNLVELKLSTRVIAKRLGVSQSTVRYWLTKFSMKTKIPRSNRGVKNIPHLCTTCREDDPKNFYGHSKSRCKICTNIDKCKKDVEKKLRAINYKGGRCERCGYNRYYGALSFHHRDPKEKEYNWNNLRNKSWETVKLEIGKCDLLCSNCHSEVHHEILTGEKFAPLV